MKRRRLCVRLTHRNRGAERQRHRGTEQREQRMTTRAEQSQLGWGRQQGAGRRDQGKNLVWRNKANLDGKPSVRGAAASQDKGALATCETKPTWRTGGGRANFFAGKELYMVCCGKRAARNKPNFKVERPATLSAAYEIALPGSGGMCAEQSQFGWGSQQGEGIRASNPVWRKKANLRQGRAWEHPGEDRGLELSCLTPTGRLQSGV
jgi:hypothetical protein